MERMSSEMQSAWRVARHCPARWMLASRVREASHESLSVSVMCHAVLYGMSVYVCG